MPMRMPAFKPRRDDSRPNAARRGYCSKRHKRWRMAVLMRDGWQCQSCGIVCVKKSQAHADHIVPVRTREDLRYDVDNGQCLCSSCHSAKTLLETRGGPC